MTPSPGSTAPHAERSESDVAVVAEQLVARLNSLSGCLVAYSGGVDSAVVAKAAFLALGDRALAVTGVSASLAAGELESARRVAADIGIAHRTLATEELASDAYLANAADRCFHCKSELYTRLRPLADELGLGAIVNGANADDRGDFRPGMTAADRQGVTSPLLEMGIDKQTVRRLAAHWRLEVADKPAMPCLSSRVAYGVSITPERLARIDAAERLLRELGFDSVRVRCHERELARLEVAPADLPRLAEPAIRERVSRELRQLGFTYVTVDLQGFRSGSFAPLVPVEALTAYARPPAQRPQG